MEQGSFEICMNGNISGRKDDLVTESGKRGVDLGTAAELPEDATPEGTAVDTIGGLGASPFSFCTREEKEQEDSDEPDPRSPRESSVCLSVRERMSRPEIFNPETNGAAPSPPAVSGGSRSGGENGRPRRTARASIPPPSSAPATGEAACERSGSTEDAEASVWGVHTRQSAVPGGGCEGRLRKGGTRNTPVPRTASDESHLKRPVGPSGSHPWASPSSVRQPKCTAGRLSRDIRTEGTEGAGGTPGGGRTAGRVSSSSQSSPSGCTSVSYLEDFYMRQRTRAAHEAQRREEARRGMTTWRGAPASKEFQWLQRLRDAQTDSGALACGSPGSGTGGAWHPTSRSFESQVRASGQGTLWRRSEGSREPRQVSKRSAAVPEETNSRLVKHLISLFQSRSTRRPSGRSRVQNGSVVAGAHPRQSPQEGTATGTQRQWATYPRSSSLQPNGGSESRAPASLDTSGHLPAGSLRHALSFPRPSCPSSSRGGPPQLCSFRSAQESLGETQHGPSRASDSLRVPAYFTPDAALMQGRRTVAAQSPPPHVSAQAGARSPARSAVSMRQTPVSSPRRSPCSPRSLAPVFAAPRPTAASVPPRLSREEVLVIQDALLRYQLARQHGPARAGLPGSGAACRPVLSAASFRGRSAGPGEASTGLPASTPSGGLLSPSQRRPHTDADARGAECRQEMNQAGGNKTDLAASTHASRGTGCGDGAVRAPAAGPEPPTHRPEQASRLERAADEGEERTRDAQTEIRREEGGQRASHHVAEKSEARACSSEGWPTGESGRDEKTPLARERGLREERAMATGGTGLAAESFLENPGAVAGRGDAETEISSDAESAPLSGGAQDTAQPTPVVAAKCEASETAPQRLDASALSLSGSTVSSCAGQPPASGQGGSVGAGSSCQAPEEALLCLADCFAAAAVGLEGGPGALKGGAAVAAGDSANTISEQDGEGTDGERCAGPGDREGGLSAASTPSDGAPEELKPYERIMLKFLQYREWLEAQDKSGGDGEARAVDDLLAALDAHGEDGAQAGERSWDADEEAQQLLEIDALLESIPDLRRDGQLFGVFDSFGASELAAEAGLFNFNFAEQDGILLFEDEGEDAHSQDSFDGAAPTEERMPGVPEDAAESLSNLKGSPLEEEAQSGSNALESDSPRKRDEGKGTASETPISASDLLRAHYFVGPLRMSQLAAGATTSRRPGESAFLTDAQSPESAKET
ncbi:conserved hypothetical protein [Neospora caninum Liverpool]|uniref:Uncharacterized protein n=1 Tax=Neospora caninum (strain Liverpool) TaxID=572307 RepID=F0VAH3_NEOCL|nr:conserved hypothetical protein [Neospora caninum Liverpool]CBZ50662.1 conserved hypothetical protein [Neospora caninum Liverpool]CEL65273.1 TPA: hypothetical protein BN1204_011290 [Neospora caninum Liverpool]|eukprot:XP_003880695.1 conserved hypothetical protein [Neospora caninum Liverpool]